MSAATLLPAASAGAARQRTVTDHERHRNDFYIDPAWCTELLLDNVDFIGPVFDPCCGAGTIPRAVAVKRGDIRSSDGSDLVYRGYGRGDCDFLADPGPYTNLIFNPPYAIAEQFILHAIGVATGKVAALVNLKFLASQGRRQRLFKPHRPQAVLILSRRPSMPPGDSGLEAKGGTADYCWVCFDNGSLDANPPTIDWIA